MRRLGVLLALPLLLALVGCNGKADPPAPRSTATLPEMRASSTPFTNWPTYHRTRARTGVATSPVTGPLTEAWRAPLTGAVYGEPLVVGSALLVATERNNVYSLNARTGERNWSTNLGAPQPLSGLECGDIDPLGITSTPVYDGPSNTVYVVAETVGGHHTLWALNASTGARRWHRDLDILPNRDRSDEQQRSALLIEHGRVITTFGGLAGDCGNYVGYATSVATNGLGAIYHYAVPTPREGGMWAPAGPVVGANGHVYVAAGNGSRTSGTWDRSDSVTELGNVKLRRISAFAPATWKADNAADLDLGSSSPVTVGDRIVIAGKRGRVYLLGQHFGGVGSAISHIDGCRAFGGAAVVGTTVLLPCKGPNKIRALTVGRSSMRWSWTANGIYASPVVAGNRVYVADQTTGDLVVLALADGHQVDRVPHVGSLTHFPSEVVSGGMVFVPTLSGITALAGP